jgi:acetyltransferase-like isoleucine patch superfamily enzyme
MSVFELAYPRKVLRSLMARTRGRLTFHAADVLGPNVQVHGVAPCVQCAGTLELGARIRFEAPVTACSLGIERGALLRIGDDCFFNDAVSITATERIVIGARALIGPGVRIMDTAFHGVSDRRRPPSRPVELGDDVWLASDCFIGPGVQIGRGAVVGAHAVVTKDVPAFAVMVGAPARQISSVDESKLLASIEEQLSLHGR